ncbi:MAG: hypothetical protein ACI9OJ_000771 [Myxococcota bacterium]|jgi:hypothetical protein
MLSFVAMNAHSLVRTFTLFITLSSTLLLIACSSSTGGGAEEETSSGEVSLGAGSGIAFGTATVIGGNKFNQVDLVATENGDNLRLQTGGATSTKSEPVNWFKLGGVPQTFAALDDVPFEKPADSDTQPLLAPKTGNGFVLKNYATGGWTRGFIKSADATTITINYEVVE